MKKQQPPVTITTTGFVKTADMWLPLLLIWFSLVRHHECQKTTTTEDDSGSIDGVAMEKSHHPLLGDRLKEPAEKKAAKWKFDWVYFQVPTWKYTHQWDHPMEPYQDLMMESQGNRENSSKIPFWEANLAPKPSPDLTPDWKVDEMPPEQLQQGFFGEFERPYKLQPFPMSAALWGSSFNNYDHPQLLGCYCCTVYRKTIPLSTCAVITTRHILTTATATELVLKDHGDEDTLEGILGAWYDVSHYGSNSSVYMTPVRIHYHPKFVMPENVNASHPIPAMFDLAVWAAKHPFQYHIDANSNRQAYVCNRAGSYWLQFGSPTLGTVKQPVAIIVGYQFMMWFKRNPLPFYKYAVKTQKYSGKCPKTEWGWFFCVWGRWAMLGLDSGAALHRATQGHSWLYDGLLGMNAFSMDLRAKEMTHYFTPVENHSVLTFLYDAYMGRLDYRYLDSRFVNAMWEAPYPKPWIQIEWKHEKPEQWSKQVLPPYFF